MAHGAESPPVLQVGGASRNTKHSQSSHAGGRLRVSQVTGSEVSQVTGSEVEKARTGGGVDLQDRVI